MSSYLRKYARYVKHLCVSYKTLAVDICRIPKGWVMEKGDSLVLPLCVLPAGKTVHSETWRLPRWVVDWGLEFGWFSSNASYLKILKSAGVIQDQLDLLTELEVRQSFRVTVISLLMSQYYLLFQFASSELSNGVINTCFLMLYKVCTLCWPIPRATP